MYRRMTLTIIWKDACISIYFILKTEEREDVNKYGCQLLSRSRPLLIIEVIIEIDLHLLADRKA